MPVHMKRTVARVVALAVGMLALGALAITPTTAAQFLTKTKADKRYLGNTSEVTSSATVSPTGGSSITAMCPAGRQAVGGGADSPASFSAASPDHAMFTLETKPVVAGGRAVGWNAEVFNVSDADPLTITTHAVCVP